MTKKSRRILFYLGVIVFFIGSGLAILNAQGYKYSFDEGKFVHTGALSLRANTDVQVFIDEKREGSTSFFGNAFGIDELLPGPYVVRLQREGYSPWQKTILVEEGLVADFPHVLLLPTEDPEEVTKLIVDIEDIFLSSDIMLEESPTPTPRKTPVPRTTASPSPSATPLPAKPFYIKNAVLYQTIDDKPVALAQGVEGFMLSENHRKILWWTPNELWVLYLADTDYPPYIKAGESQRITKLATPILRAAWYHGEDHIVLDSAGYKIIEIDKRGGTNIIKL